MTAKRGSAPRPLDPIGVNRAEAADFVGFALPTFDKLVYEGLMPAPREIRDRLVWDVDELRTAFKRLPHRKVDLKPGATPMHDEHLPDDPFSDIRA